MGDAKATLPETDDLPSLAALLHACLETTVKSGRRQVGHSRQQFQTVTIKMNISQERLK
jgi:hypothetical protein